MNSEADKFDTQDYYKNILQCSDDKYYPFFNFLHKAFSKDTCPTGRMIEFGSGPGVEQLISASKKFNYIICSDIAPENCKEIEKWMHKDPDALDQMRGFEVVAEMEGNKDSAPQLVDRVRTAVKEALVCDVLPENPFAPRVLEPFDAMLMLNVLERACPDEETFRRTLKQLVTKHLRQGGMLIMGCTMTNVGFYTAGESRFAIMPFDKSLIEKACIYAGLHIASLVEEKYEHDASGGDQAIFTLYLVAHRS